MELSELPETTSWSRYWRHAMPRLCPFSVRTNSQVDMSQTLIVRSPDAETMYRRSKSITLTAARWPTSTRRTVISVAACMSQTAMDRSCTNSQHQCIITTDYRKQERVLHQVPGPWLGQDAQYDTKFVLLKHSIYIIMYKLLHIHWGLVCTIGPPSLANNLTLGLWSYCKS